MSSLPVATTRFIRPQGLIPRERTAELSARLALDHKTRRHAFALRHASYLAGGYIDARANGLFSDPYDDMPNCVSIVVYKRGLPVASVRLCTLDNNPGQTNRTDIPALHVFNPEITHLLKTTTSTSIAKATEINRLVRHPDFTNDYELVFILFRFVSFMVLHQQSDVTLSCVRRNHMTFYKRIGFESIAGPRAYPELKFTTNLMACPSSQYASLKSTYDILNTHTTETSRYAGLFDGETVPVFSNPQVTTGA